MPLSAENPIYITDVTAEDIPLLRPILEQSIIDNETGEVIYEEINDILSAVKGSTEGYNGKQYTVAKDSHGNVLGMIGMQDMSNEMHAFATSTKNDAVELINAFVSPAARGLGIGKLLVRNIEIVARQYAYDEVIVNSGPRYKVTGWGFWTKMYGEPVGVQKDLYGSGIDAPVWRKSLIR